MHVEVSVITPTYNRANTLPRLFESLCAQTYLNFEWIIIDDGSSDNTKELVAEMIASAPFETRYYYKENGGVHTARNMGAKKAKGRLIYFIDSDNTFPPYAIERGLSIWNGLKRHERYWGIRGRCMDPDTEKMLGEPFPDFINSLPRKKQYRLIHKKYHIECNSIFNAEILKKHPCPEPEGVRFIPEGSQLNELRAKYDAYYVNDIFRLYFQEQEDRLTKKGPIWDTLYPAYLYYLDMLNRIYKMSDIFSYREKWLCVFKLAYVSIRIGKPLRVARGQLKDFWNKTLLTMCYLPILLYAKAKNTANSAVQNTSSQH